MDKVYNEDGKIFRLSSPNEELLYLKDNLKDLVKQRKRWHIGLADTLLKHRDMILNLNCILKSSLISLSNILFNDALLLWHTVQNDYNRRAKCYPFLVYYV